jgi:hypothetical protein
MDPDDQATFAEPGALVGVVLGPALAGIVDLTRPVDILIPSWPNDGSMPRGAAFAFTLAADATPNDSLRSAFALRQGRGGGIALEAVGDRRAVGGVGSKIECELWPSPALAQRGRLVCASDADMLPAYSPYIARGMPAAATAANMRLEIEGSLFRAFAATKESEEPVAQGEVERAGREIGKQWVADLLDDWGNSALEVSLGLGRVDLTWEQTFRSSRSMMTAVTCADPSAPTPAPPALFRMPADADMAFFVQGAPKEAMKTRGPAAWRQFIQSYPEALMPTRAREEVVAAVTPFLLTGGPVVVAYGQDRQASRDALDEFLTTKPPPGPPPGIAGRAAVDAGLQKARHALQGWTLVHVNEPFEVWAKGMRDVLRVENTYYKGDGRTPWAAGPNKPSQWFVEKRVSPSDGLPAGSLHFVISEKVSPGRSSGKDAELPHDVHIWLAPEGGATWIAGGEDPKLAREKLRQVLSSPASGKAGAPLGLDALRGKQGAGMGAATLAGFVSLFLGDGSRAEMEESERRLTHLYALPGRGKLAMPLVWTSEPRGGQNGTNGCRVRFSTSLNLDALGSLIEWGKAYAPEGRSRRQR